MFDWHSDGASPAPSGLRWALRLALLTSLVIWGQSAARAEITLLNVWGDSGAGNSQFNRSRDVAIAAGGDVYVADVFNNRIQRFDHNGGFLGAWGGLGAGNGQFDTPTGVGIGPTGDVYVAEFTNNRVQHFDGSGAFLGVWGSMGIGDGQFIRPQDVAVSSAGNVYVADTSNDRVQKFSDAGTFASAWGTTGTGNSQFVQPISVSVASWGDVFVADLRNDRIERFDSAGAFVGAWGTTGSGAGQLNQPWGVTVSPAGDVYVADTLNHRIQKFTSGGAFIAAWGSPGSGDGQFNRPHSVAISGTGEVYVTDTFNDRMQRFFDSEAWVFGANSFPAADVGVGQLLGAAQTLSAGKVLQVSGATTIHSGGRLTLGGGNTDPALESADLQIQAGGVLAIELGGTTPNLLYGRAEANTLATLAGTLEVSLVGGFLPSLGDVFGVLAFGSRAGDFASYTGLDVGGHLALRHAFTANSLILTARPAIDGDINLDGTVDIFDINVVSSHWNGAGPQGDANGDGIVDIFDVNLISSNWGATAGGGTVAVPEPATSVLFAGALFALLTYGRCGRTKHD